MQICVYTALLARWARARVYAMNPAAAAWRRHDVSICHNSLAARALADGWWIRSPAQVLQEVIPGALQAPVVLLPVRCLAVDAGAAELDVVLSRVQAAAHLMAGRRRRRSEQVPRGGAVVVVRGRRAEREMLTPWSRGAIGQA